MAFLRSAFCDSSKQNTTKHQDSISQELKAHSKKKKKKTGYNYTKIKCMMFLLNCFMCVFVITDLLANIMLECTESHLMHG